MRYGQTGLLAALVLGGLVLGLAGPAQAALQGRLPATPGGTDYQAYYDTDLNITWAANANLAQTSGFDADGRMPWTVANAWAAGLTIGGGDWLAAADGGPFVRVEFQLHGQ